MTRLRPPADEQPLAPRPWDVFWRAFRDGWLIGWCVGASPAAAFLN